MQLVSNNFINSITTLRGITNATRDINLSLDRLSTGKTINKASDSPSVVSQVDKFEAEILSTSRASKNVAQSISLLDVAEEAISEASNLLDSLSELAVRGEDRSLSSTDRSITVEEFATTLGEIESLALNTAFGYNRLLNGDFVGRLFQNGPALGNVVSVTIGSLNPASLGAYRSAGPTRAALSAASTAGVNTTTASEDIIITSNGTSATVDVAAEDSALDVAAKINAVTYSTSVSAEATTFAHLFSNSGSLETYTVKINGYSTSSFTISSSDVSDAVAKLNLISASTGVTATATTDNKVLLHDTSGEDITIENDSSGTNLNVTAIQSDGTSDQGNHVSLADGTASGNDSTRVIGSISFTSHLGFSLSQSGDSNLGYATSGIAQFSNLNSVSLSSDNESRIAASVVAAAQEQLASVKGDISSNQSRLEASQSILISNLDSKREALSKLEDVDFALESAKLAKAILLREINTALLSQINMSSGLVLKLISDN